MSRQKSAQFLQEKQSNPRKDPQKVLSPPGPRRRLRHRRPILSLRGAKRSGNDIRFCLSLRGFEEAVAIRTPCRHFFVKDNCQQRDGLPRRLRLLAMTPLRAGPSDYVIARPQRGRGNLWALMDGDASGEWCIEIATSLRSSQ